MIFLKLKWALRSWLQKVPYAIAGALPRWLVYYATIRLIAHGTTGQYGATDVANVNVITVLDRWNSSSKL